MTVRGLLILEAGGVRGHAYDDADPTRRLAVEMLVDGRVADLARADAFAPEAAAVGDGCYGFGFVLPATLVDEGRTVVVRLANSEEPIGAPLRRGSRRPPADEAVGHVAWQGGLRLSGWVATMPGEAATVRVIVDRAVAAEAATSGWIAVTQGGVRTVRASFDLHLPASLADGRVHRARVVDGRGRPLSGSPCAVLAFPDGLRDFLLARSELVAGDPRVAAIEALTPQSLPFADIDRWSAAHPPLPISGHVVPGTAAVVLVGDAVDLSVSSLEAQRGCDWVALQASDGGSPGRFAPAEVAAFLAAERGASTVVLALAGTRFRPEADRPPLGGPV